MKVLSVARFSRLVLPAPEDPANTIFRIMSGFSDRPLLIGFKLII